MKGENKMAIAISDVITIIKALVADGEKLSKIQEIISDLKELISDIRELLHK